MKALFAAVVFLSGCAFTQPPPKPAPLPLRPGEIYSAPAAAAGLAIGYSTKSDVRAALGEGTVVDFPSGYEVWLYRQRRPEQPVPTGELVLLFEPSGVLAKLRMN